MGRSNLSWEWENSMWTTMSTHADRETGNKLLKWWVMCEVCRVLKSAGIGFEIDNSSSKYWSWALQDIWSQSSRYYSLLRALLSFRSYPAQLSSFLCRTHRTISQHATTLYGLDNGSNKIRAAEIEWDWILHRGLDQPNIFPFKLRRIDASTHSDPSLLSSEGWIPVYMIQSRNQRPATHNHYFTNNTLAPTENFRMLGWRTFAEILQHPLDDSVNNENSGWPIGCLET